jgi:chromosome partitioning protein
MRRVIFNQKGGVGKSTITCNLAAISATLGRKTLVIDLDIQGNSTQYLLGAKETDANQSIVRFFKDCLSLGLFSGQKTKIETLIQETPFPHLSIIPAHTDLESLQGRLESRYKIYKLKEVLDTLDNFDDIYIDTPPILNFYSQSALIAADKCLIPFDCDAFAKEALQSLMTALAEVKTDHNQQLDVEGIVVNQFQSQANLPRQLVAELLKAGYPVLKNKISPSVKVRESHTYAQPLIHYAPNHKLSEEFKALYAELTTLIT